MKKFFALVSFISISTSALAFSVKADTPKPAAPPTAIRMTPPAPKIADAERQQELAARRARVFAEMKDNSVLILMSAAPKVYTNDVDFLYRQENNLYYLTNLKQQNATLVMVKSGGSTAEFLFIPKRNPQFETWNGHMYSTEEVANISGIKTILESSEFEDRKEAKGETVTKGFFTLLKEKQPFASKSGFSFTPSAENLYLLTPVREFETEDTREYQREWDLAKSLANVSTDEKTRELVYGKTGNYQIISANPIFTKLRSIKTPYEIRMMQHAIDISTEAHMRAMATVRQVKWEYETQAEIEYVFRRRNADYWGYPSIVGCGPNATTLHYVESQSEVKPGSLMLIDVGAEYDHLTADVTRTFPANGKFSKEQADIYRIVYDAQETAAAAMKPGGRFFEPNQASRKTVEEGLAKLGLITAVGALIPGTEQKVPDGKGGTQTIGIPQSRIWYMHGLGHWLGMNVHDVGGSGSSVFRPGMIMTNEPGIYVREDALNYFDQTKPGMKEFLDKIRPAFEKYKTIGVRIEDDMLITDTGVEWLTKALPRKLEDVEYFMAKASNDIKIGALNNPNAPTLASTDANFLETGFQPSDIFALAPTTTGKTVRYGWTFSGKATTYSALDHSHAE
jgi:Xaa-Pro aminopeptidase